ncbi:hypothetical protein [Couchioplanes caeruleus]|uniref:WD40 repeat protein n=2 Tax=Couchioplanes caeruleus TaxID=56438 RepID=A0A1K0G468_9ACTN|nr:hypothetical protein [Couchioplanes caeruleus]OJF12082.1 hypothetical protein BG844_22590 [Couchioplanes caeruleus subsp. caeruleus]ROP28290.1 hypothetical protein EDD30_1033 [Couchioplanes caeruleus]
MGENRLAELLQEAASGIAAPSLAEAAWARARRVRRRRYATICASAAAVLAVTAGLVLPLGGRGLPNPPTTTPPAQQPVAHLMPGTLPRRGIAPLPDNSTGMAPRDAPKLSEHPLDRAVAVVQPYAPEGSSALQPVYALGTDGTWVRVDVVDLVLSNDAQGNHGVPLTGSALSPDRRRIALPQPDALVVVDLTTAKAHRIAVRGFNEQVLWWGNRTVLVGQGGPGAVAVDWAAGTATPTTTGLSTWDSAGPATEGAPVVELTAADPKEGQRPRLGVRQWRLGEPAPVSDVPVDDTGLGPQHGVLGWNGPAISDGAERAVRAGWGISGTFHGVEMMAVVNTRTGVVERMLDLGRDRYKGCCRPLDWVDRDTILAQTDKEGLIAWDLRTGAVTQVIAGSLSAAVAVRLHNGS